jgi:hypothetical protein
MRIGTVLVAGRHRGGVAVARAFVQLPVSSGNFFMATNTSQAEYAGSIPVIGSTKIKAEYAPAATAKPGTKGTARVAYIHLIAAYPEALGRLLTVGERLESVNLPK